MFVTDAYEPRFYEYNNSGCLSFEVMLQMLENTALHHTMLAHDALVNEEAAWVLADWRVDIANRPRRGQKIHVKTWVHGRARSAAMTRDFLAFDDNGEELFRASARYALVDLKTKRLTRIGEELFDAYGVEQEIAFPADAPKLKAPEEYEFAQPIFLRRRDIDYNGHVHNTRYIEFAVEALPEDAYRADAFSSFRVICSSSVEAGSRPEIRRTATENGWLFSICVEDKVCTLIQMTL